MNGGDGGLASQWPIHAGVGRGGRTAQQDRSVCPGTGADLRSQLLSTPQPAERAIVHPIGASNGRPEPKPQSDEPRQIQPISGEQIFDSVSWPKCACWSYPLAVSPLGP